MVRCYKKLKGTGQVIEQKIINLYIEVIEKIAINSADCRYYMKSGDIDILMDYLDQRSALINIFKTLKIKIANDFPTSVQIDQTVNQFLKKSEQFNQEILTFLDLEKAKTKLEIAKTFKNKENLKGYNLSSTK